MYNNAGIMVGIGATGTSVLAATGSSLSWLGYALGAAAVVIGGLLALRTQMLKRMAPVAVGSDDTEAELR